MQAAGRSYLKMRSQRHERCAKGGGWKTLTSGKNARGSNSAGGDLANDIKKYADKIENLDEKIKMNVRVLLKHEDLMAIKEQLKSSRGKNKSYKEKSSAFAFDDDRAGKDMASSSERHDVKFNMKEHVMKAHFSGSEYNNSTASALVNSNSVASPSIETSDEETESESEDSDVDESESLESGSEDSDVDESESLESGSEDSDVDGSESSDTDVFDLVQRMDDFADTLAAKYGSI
ncbi:uncharacterized protein [Atheta coriaria]|uniref:uncharacterized protein n=1 Tax=Dalotia coriaria TaxID=877792 RepID=UPI0031F43DCB